MLLKTGCPQEGQSTFMSIEKSSTSPPHAGHFFILIVGVLKFSVPGHLNNMHVF
jgi:hypothetical protein